MTVQSIKGLLARSFASSRPVKDLSPLSHDVSRSLKRVGIDVNEPFVKGWIKASGDLFGQAVFLGVMDIFNREYAGRVIPHDPVGVSRILEVSLPLTKKLYDLGLRTDDLPDLLDGSYRDSFTNENSFGNFARRAIESLHEDPAWLRTAPKHEPRIIVCEDETEVAKRAGDEVLKVVAGDPKAKLGFATGRTMIPLLSYLVNKGNGALSNVTATYLDEYIGEAPDKMPMTSYRQYMTDRLYGPLGVKISGFFDPDAGSLTREAERYESLISNNSPLDIQVLGIGDEHDIHIAFNQKYSSFDSLTRVAGLSAAIRIKNAPDFHDDPDRVCDLAFTMGLLTLRRHFNRVLLLAVGPGKRESVRLMLARPTEEVPASSLLLRDGVTIIVDRAANPS
jgi:glucosamine-6-phosphate deaminase